MRKVIMIVEDPKEEKALEFTHVLNQGWIALDGCMFDYDKIVYLGKCKIDGDMFAAYNEGTIDIFKGNLNNGTY